MAKKKRFPVEIESNPIVRVNPPIGKRYPIRIVGREIAKLGGSDTQPRRVKKEIGDEVLDKGL